MFENERKAVCEYAVKMWQAGFVVGSAGNVSVRGPEKGHYIITPSSVSYDALTPEQVVVIDDDEELVEGERAPSFETPVHLAVYRKRPDVNAVIHCHSKYATIMAVLRRQIPPVVDESVVYFGGPVDVAKYAASGSDDLAKNVVEALGPKAAVLLANHGSLCVGKDLKTAFKISELVEHIAHIIVTASLLGGALTPLPDEVLDYEKEMYEIVKSM
jgi:L-fuculose-phosphate aldolase